MKQTPQRRFKAVKIRLMKSPLFCELSGIMMLGKTTLSETFPTATTNGRDEVYGLPFTESLKDKELGFVIIHENMHKAARHLTVYTQLHKINPMKANMACDYWINGKIKKADPDERYVAMPQHEGKDVGLFDQKYEGWTVKRIFDALPNPPENQGRGSGGAGEGFDEHDWDGAGQMTKQELQELEQDIKQAIQQGQMAARRAGHGSSNSALGLGELIQTRNDWRALMRQFFTNSCTAREESSWRRPNRRFIHQDIYMPTLEGTAIREGVFAIDASGSMFFQNALGRAISAVKDMAASLNIEKVHVLYWDGSVEHHEEYDLHGFKNFSLQTSPHGGGGTTPGCIPPYLKEKGINPEFTMVLTDGDVCGWGEWNHPVLWAIACEHNKGLQAPIGQTIHVED